MWREEWLYIVEVVAHTSCNLKEGMEIVAIVYGTLHTDVNICRKIS